MKKFLFGLILGIIIGCGVCYYLSQIGKFFKEDVVINEEVLKEKLETCSELTSAKYQLTGQITREEHYQTGYDFLNSISKKLSTKSFTINYAATIAFAVDLSKAKIKVDSSIVRINLPSATMQSLSIPSDSLQIVNEKKNLINWENKNDMKEALQDAEKHALKTCDTTKMIRLANAEAVKTLTTLLCPLTETENGEKAYQVIITINGETDNTVPIDQQPNIAK